ncbi:DUF3800 domain-containing protein [Phytoactinopolyspora endophytica]|uniref:DUF3800 domain-containing protein n=1 Tax=Phytoactinopolyspora endophytica TaxID=1642495 RepID=UPI003B83329C
MILHDESSENATICNLARRAQATCRLVDDPVPRVSHSSYFIQLADLIAYSGWRTYRPPSAAVSAVAPATLWNEPGDARLRTPLTSSRLAPGVIICKDKAPQLLVEGREAPDPTIASPSLS